MVVPTLNNARLAETPLRPPEACKVLIVDDDDRIVEALSAMLAREGYRILSAANGRSALDMITSEAPDVSVLDVLLPDVDGIEVCRRIKAQQRFQMIILMTGYSARARRLDGLAAGADDFLNKPIDPVELVARVRALLRTKQLYDEVEAHRIELERRVTERTQELRAANLRLQELNAVKSNVLAIVSHELRTPLLKVKSGLWLALQSDIEPNQQIQIQHTVDAALDLLEYRISDVAVFADPSDMTLVAASVGDLLSGAVEQVRVLQSGAESAMNISVARNLPPVHVDPASITRALAHIIDNAVKFGEGRPVSIDAKTDNKSVRVVVRDQGIGIADDIRETMFAPLQQGDDSTTRRHSGLGMGLALVKMILDAHHVPLEFKSKVGQGTTVTVIFPILGLD